MQGYEKDCVQATTNHAMTFCLVMVLGSLIHHFVVMGKSTTWQTAWPLKARTYRNVMRCVTTPSALCPRLSDSV
jgi:hypothetical protein